MKTRLALALALALAAALLLAGGLTPLTAQQPPDAAGTDTTPPGSTVVTSDELHVDQETHTAVFSGNVVATGTNFSLKCQEMTVYFNKESKVDKIGAKGDVIIQQPGRITHSGQAEYFRDEDKFVLTDQPTILDNKNQISAPQIIIYRTKQSLYTVGRTKTTLQEGIGGGAPAATETK